MACSSTLNRLYCYWDKAVIQSHTIKIEYIVECYEFPISSQINVKKKVSLLQKHDEYLF